MTQSRRANNPDSETREIRLLENPDGQWTARDLGAEISAQGKTRDEALEALDDVVAALRGEAGESIDSWEEEKAVLEELGIDPDEVRAAREADRELPEFMQ